jgi:hypothetical protein
VYKLVVNNRFKGVLPTFSGNYRVRAPTPSILSTAMILPSSLTHKPRAQHPDVVGGARGPHHAPPLVEHGLEPPAHTWVENIYECAQLILKICSLVWSRYTWCAHQWLVKKRHSASSIDSMLHCLCPVFLKSWLVERQQRNIDGVGEETTMGKGH